MDELQLGWYDNPERKNELNSGSKHSSVKFYEIDTFSESKFSKEKKLEALNITFHKNDWSLSRYPKSELAKKSTSTDRIKLYKTPFFGNKT